MNSYYMIGLFCGIFIGLVLIFSLLKITRTDRSRQLKYDERQMAVRGKGYKYGFFAMMIADILYGVLENASKQTLANPLAAMVICMCIGIFVYAAYGIWNEAYFALNEQPKRIILLFLIISVVNIASGISNYLHGTLIVDGTLQTSSSNLTTGILILAILITIFIKKMASGNEED